MENLPTKILLMAVIEKDETILMRKKPAGSAPYEETWYIFGCERDGMKDDSETLGDYIYNNFGIIVNYFGGLGQDNENKEDHDGVMKSFTYIYFRCEYQEGEINKPQGVERIEWVPKNKLSEYDIVPPSVKLFKKLGYLR